MKFAIVGYGRVGARTADILSSEGHDVVIVESVAQRGDGIRLDDRRRVLVGDACQQERGVPSGRRSLVVEYGEDRSRIWSDGGAGFDESCECLARPPPDDRICLAQRRLQSLAESRRVDCPLGGGVVARL